MNGQESQLGNMQRVRQFSEVAVGRIRFEIRETRHDHFTRQHGHKNLKETYPERCPESDDRLVKRKVLESRSGDTHGTRKNQ